MAAISLLQTSTMARITSKASKRAQNKAKPRTRARLKLKAKTTTSASPSERIDTDVLLAIKPDHLANIISREKNHEYRKYRLKDGVVRLWLYETAGGGGRASITHIASIPSCIRHEPGSVPTEPPGIGNAEFNAGLKQSKFGYPILELYELVNPVTLSEMKTRWAMGGAPMGWRYLDAPLWGDRWGKDHTRDDKVKKVF